jgi:inorganic pyrophosphatase
MRALVEAQAGSYDKHTYDPDTHERRSTRRLLLPYPYPYGFLLGTRAEDGDALDCYLITRDPLAPGAIVECEPIGLLEQRENDAIDHKILARIPGRAVEIDAQAESALRDFIHGIFAAFPDVRVSVGAILPREAALAHIRACEEKR